MNSIQLNTRDPEANPQRLIQFDQDTSIQIFRKDHEPENTCRLNINFHDFELELLPTKGLSVGQLTFNARKIFWDAPFNLPDPDQLNLWSDEIMLNQSAAPGFTFIKTFCGGIELYGLTNWGMPANDLTTGDLLPLHGETSNIPVERVEIKQEINELEISGTFIYRDFNGDPGLPWYQRGTEIYQVEKRIILSQKACTLTTIDKIKNLTDSDQEPNWGYHYTLFPQPGAYLKVDSANKQVRGGGKAHPDSQTWFPADQAEARQEVGVIHQGLSLVNLNGKDLQKVSFHYPDQNEIEVLFTPAPYFQSWFCAGGANQNEFTDKTGKSIMLKNWDGIGFEIGSNALDHDQNIDAGVRYQRILKPGESRIIEIITSLKTSSS